MPIPPAATGTGEPLDQLVPIARPARGARPAGLTPAAPAGPPKDSGLSVETILKPTATPPQHGWRRAAWRLTRGRWHPGPSADELDHRALVARVKRPITESHMVLVVSRKGGVGKTTTTVMLGHTFATWRGDRILALDGNPDAGTLGDRIHRETAATIADLLTEGDHIRRYITVRGYTSQAASGLEVVAAPDDPQITAALDAGDYSLVLEVLEQHYTLIVCDAGTGILDSATQGLLGSADQLVVVTAPSVDEITVAARTLDWLEAHDHSALARQAVVVVNKTDDDDRVDLDTVTDYFNDRARTVVPVPTDPALRAGGHVDLNGLAPATRRAYLTLAAAVADGFATQRN